MAIVVLLHPNMAAKAQTLAGFLESHPPFISAPEGNFLQEAPKLVYCPAQNLLQSHLTVQENLRLFGAYAGVNATGWRKPLHRFLAEVSEKTKISELPRLHLRKLLFLIATLPDHNLVLCDDLASGLSGPARRDLWQFLMAADKQHPCTLLYTTTELEPAQALNAETWLLREGEIRQVWQPGQMPAFIRSAAGFRLAFGTPSARQTFEQSLSSLPFVNASRTHSPLETDVFSQSEADIVTLAWLAGFDLKGLERIAPDASLLWRLAPVQLAPIATAEKRRLPALLPSGQQRLSLRQNLRAIFLTARCEWRGHFRSFWGAGNLLFSTLYLLLFLLGISPSFNSPAQFVQAAPYFLLFAAAMAIGLSFPSFNRWIAVSEAETLFEPARSIHPAAPFSRLRWADTMPIRRTPLLIGLITGNLVVYLLHAWPVTLFGLLTAVAFPGAPALIIGSLTLWALLSWVALMFSLWLSTAIRHPRHSVWLGWLFSFGLLLISAGLLRWPALGWLWPFTAYLAAFQRALTASQIWLPLFVGLAGTLACTVLAISAFQKRRSLP